MRLNRPRVSLLAACLLTSPAAFAQSQPYESDPFARREGARQAAARDLLGQPHLERMTSLRDALRLDSRHSFQVVNAGTDDVGGSHARLQQSYLGVKVSGGSVLSHLDAAGVHSYTDALKRDISVSIHPTLSEQAALDIVARQPSHTRPYSWAPRVELRIHPVVQQLHARTGARPVDSGLDHLSPEVIPEETNAQDYTTQVAGYRLAYFIRTVEGREGFGEPHNAMEYLVDAHSGALLSERSALHGAVGTGSGRYSGLVSLDTSSVSGGFRMFDASRNYTTWDDDTSASSATNTDANNAWGDGQPYAGDGLASATNRQSAMVDAHFGAAVYWDLMSNVFGREGPDGKHYAVNFYTHVGSNWNNGHYSLLSGNVSLGDGMERVEMVGHEAAHALNDFTIGLSGGEAGGLNESNSDIWGAMASFYLRGDGFANAAPTIPETGGTWRVFSRNMQKPSLTRHPDAWYPTLEDAEVHSIGAPNDRAFYFLAKGASPAMSANTYSPYLPWGMTGIGNTKAARIWFHALLFWMDGSTNYLGARQACLDAAASLFGMNSPEYRAAQNAYAGINVGSRASNYPAPPPTMSEQEPNDVWQSANLIARPVAPKPAGAPDKISVKGNGTSTDWFKVSLKPGQKATFRLLSSLSADYNLFVYDSFNTLMGSSSKAAGSYDLVSFTTPSGLDPTVPQEFFIKVQPNNLSSLGINLYVLDVDFH